VRTDDGSLAWSQTYNESVADLLATQADIAEQAVDGLQIVLGESEREFLTARPTADATAYEHYMRGNLLWDFVYVGSERWKQIAEQYERAVALDPEFAEAHARFSMASSVLYFMGRGQDPTQERLATAREAAQRASARRITTAPFRKLCSRSQNSPATHWL
jgi:hypothetical protein